MAYEATYTLTLNGKSSYVRANTVPDVLRLLAAVVEDGKGVLSGNMVVVTETDKPMELEMREKFSLLPLVYTPELVDTLDKMAGMLSPPCVPMPPELRIDMGVGPDAFLMTRRHLVDFVFAAVDATLDALIRAQAIRKLQQQLNEVKAELAARAEPAQRVQSPAELIAKHTSLVGDLGEVKE